MQVFEFDNYSQHLKFLLTEGARRIPRGRLSRLAEFVGCHTTFIRQVLSERAHFSNEQAYRFCIFGKLSAEETEYFVDLVQMNRAGTDELKTFFKKKLH